MVGRADLLDVAKPWTHWKADGLDLAPILHRPELPDGTSLRRVTDQNHHLDQARDHALIAAAEPRAEDGTAVRAGFTVRNVHRTVGTMLGYAGHPRRRAGQGLAEGTIDFTLTGSAGPVLRGVPARRCHATSDR